MGVEESNQLGAMSSEQAQQAATLSESARNTWLNSLMGMTNLGAQGQANWLTSLTNLANQKPAGQWWTDTSSSDSGQNIGSMALSTIGQGASTYFTNQSNQDWYTNLLKSLMGTGGTANSATGTGLTQLDYDKLFQKQDILNSGLSGYYDKQFGSANPTWQ